MGKDGRYVRLSVIPERDVDSALDARIRSALCVCFPDAVDDFARSRAWHGSAPAWTIVAEDQDGIVCGHLGIVDRIIRAGAEPLRVAGVQSVCVLPERRGEGLAERMLEIATTIMRDRTFDAGLLFCVPALTRIYARYGWRLLDNASVTRVDSNGTKLPLPQGSIAMWLQVRITKWPAGDIHLGENDW